ncbi:MAG: hypothetical protein ACOC20_02055, partial [Oceanicaulis sp.]
VAMLMQTAVPLESIETYVREDFDRTVTECDRLIGHPADPEGVTEGVSQAEADLPAAIAACEAAVAADPGNPRLNYQLARAYGYSGLHVEGQPYRDAALAAGYPQSLFVVGYIRLENWDGRGADPCYGGELIRRSAHAGRFAGLVGFPHYALTGAFEACEAYPVIDREEMLGFLEEAAPRAEDYYQGLLVTQLRDRLQDGAD